MKVYLDTCILSRLIDLNIKDEELKALDAISESPEVDLVTSEKTLEEFLNTSDDKKKMALKVLFKLITKVKKNELTESRPALWGTVMWGTAPWGCGVTEEKPLYSRLKTIFDSDDASHIFQAISNNCDIFLTLDRKTILSRVEKNDADITQLTQMKFVTPVSLKQLLAK